MLPTESSLPPRVFDDICRKDGCPQVNLFTTRGTAKLCNYVSPIPDTVAWNEGIFQHPRDNPSIYAFPPFALFRQVLSRVLFSQNFSMVLVAPLLSQKEWFLDLQVLLVEEPFKLILWNLLIQPHIRKLHWHGVAAATSVEPIKRLFHKVDFCKEVAEIIATDIRKSIACLYQVKWSRFLN